MDYIDKISSNVSRKNEIKRGIRTRKVRRSDKVSKINSVYVIKGKIKNGEDE